MKNRIEIKMVLYINDEPVGSVQKTKPVLGKPWYAWRKINDVINDLYFKSETEEKSDSVQRDDIIFLKKDAKVFDSFSDKPLPKQIVNDYEIWVIERYERKTGMLYIKRAIKPYPGAHCGKVHIRDIEKI
ncbi:MAG: hypothetical protein SV062_08750 [Thermodesulfobacteriota bacterium]|nr:hypothetical protein [Thermodesulfobacteriota bacterium]